MAAMPVIPQTVQPSPESLEPIQPVELPIATRQPMQPPAEPIRPGPPQPISHAEAIIEQPALEKPEGIAAPPPSEIVPSPGRPRSNLSGVERFGLLGLFVLLLLGGAVVVWFSLKGLPAASNSAKAGDFPMKGSHLTISNATSYWRAPIADGPKAEVFRRGTKLIPVVSLTVSGGPAAIRVFFRNSDKELVGDAVTRAYNGGTTFEAAATAGFDDEGMHAAYRAGQSKPWTMEVQEASSINSPSSQFKPIFEMEIAPNKR